VFFLGRVETPCLWARKVFDCPFPNCHSGEGRNPGIANLKIHGKRGQDMKRWLFCSFLALSVCVLPVSAFSHGTKGTVERGGLVVSAQYNTGEPMDYAKVTVSAPGAKVAFQSARTDRNGRFCFFPDGPGEWQVVVNDEMGHRLEIKVPVDEQLAFQEGRNDHAPQEAGLSTFGKAAMGVSIIFGFCGLFFWWKGTKRTSLN
jgi:nickel transport protein